MSIVSPRKRCRRRVALIFGLLSLAAALLPPIRSSTIVLRRDPKTNAVWRKTSVDRSYEFLWMFLAGKNDPLLPEDSYPVRYALQRYKEVRTVRTGLDVPLWVLEFGLIGLLGVFDFIFFCKRRNEGETRPAKA